MEDKKSELAILCLFFLPVVLAIIGVILEFNIIDLVYLLAVLVLFIKYLLIK